MANLSVSALRDELLNFSAVEIENNVLQSFQYEGFNATYLYGQLRSKEADFATFNREMSLLCLVGMMRGTRIDRISASMSAAGSTLLAQLVNKYTVVSTVVATNRKGSITIGRIMSVFPHVCLSFAAAGHIRDFGLNREYTLPAACRFPQFAALIPTTADYSWLWESFLDWAYDMDEVINGARSNVENVERFANITSTNSLFDNTKRLSILAANNLSFDADDEVLAPPAAQQHAQSSIPVPVPLFSGPGGHPTLAEVNNLIPPPLSQGTPLVPFSAQNLASALQASGQSARSSISIPGHQQQQARTQQQAGPSGQQQSGQGQRQGGSRQQQQGSGNQRRRH